MRTLWNYQPTIFPAVLRIFATTFFTTIVPLFVLACFAGLALATDHSGTISANETWLAADNPHNVLNSVTVNAGITLTIEDGAEVFFDANRSLTIRGTLSAIGTPGTGILFTQNTISNWYGLSFQGGGGGVLENSSIEHGSYGIVLNTSGTVSVENSTIRDGNYGINATNGTLEFTNVLVTGNTSYGFYGNDVQPTLLDANTIFENSATGVYLTNIPSLSFTSPVTIRNTTTTGLQINLCEGPAINNITFENNTGTYGAIYLQNCDEFTLGAGNSIGGTGVEASWPVTITAGSYPGTSCVIPTSGNANNEIQVYGGSSDRIGTWNLFAGLNYLVSNSPTIAAGGQLTIVDGVQVDFAGNRNLTIRGTLIAIGTPGTGILFTQSTTAAWHSLSFQGGGGGTLENCIIEHATYGLYMNTSATVAVENSLIHQGNHGANVSNGSLELSNVQFSDHSTYGYYGNGVEPVFLDANTVFENCPTGVYLTNIPSLDFSSPVTIRNTTTAGLQINLCDNPLVNNVTLENNTGTYGAVYFQNCGEFTLGSGNSIGGAGVGASWPVTITSGSYPGSTSSIPTTGNANNDIQVYGGASPRQGTWPLFPDLKYVVNNNPTISAGGQLTIDDGVEVNFGANRNLTIRGILTAIGSPGGGIVFTQNTASNWSGLSFLAGGSGIIENCLIENATYGLTVNTSNTVSVENTTITDGNYGLHASAGTLELSNVMVTGCSTYGFYGNGMQPTFMDAATVFEDCPTGVYLANISSLNFSSPVTIRNTTTAGLQINNCNQPQVDNITLEDNTGLYGAIYLQNCGDFYLGAGNTIGGAGLECSWPVTITAGSYPEASCVIPVSGNSRNNIQVYGGASDHSGTWPLFTDRDYIISNSPTISAGGQLIIEDAVQVYFAANRNITVRGSLVAIGTPGTGILFTQDTATAWAGLSFQSGGYGSLENCVIEHATYGLTVNTSGTVAVANSIIRDGNYGVHATNGDLEMSSVLVTGNSSYGFYGNTVQPIFLDADTVFEDCPTGVYLNNIPSLEFSAPVTISHTTTVGLHLNICDDPLVNNVLFEENTGLQGALYFQNCGDIDLGAGNSIGGTGVEASWPVTITAGSYLDPSCVIPIAGNVNNDIQVYGGNSDRTGIWRQFSHLDYVVTTSPTIAAGGQLSIEEGVTVKFGANRNITVRGILSAVGTPIGRIQFIQNTASDWSGLSFPGGGGGTIEYCTIEDATYGISANTTGTVSVSNTIIREGNYGVYATNGNLSFLHSIIQDNSGYGFYVTNAILQFGSNDTEWNDIFGNGTGQAGRNYRNGPNDVSVPWVYWGTDNQTTIEYSIWHEADDAALGLVTYLPYASEEHDPLSPVDEFEVPELQIPRTTAIFQNYPNPFNPATMINFDLNRSTPVKIQVFDISGRWVADLVDRAMPAGHHVIAWNGQDDQGRGVSSGVYLYQFLAGDINKTMRMVLVR
ncbi:MAG: T9SS type A sorting domain-containing protein [bacterium]|nr:T9SS type A sorting domain-containing protein [bacterium]